MLPSKEETQTQLSKVQIQNAQNINRAAKTKSYFASEALSQIDYQPHYTECSMKVVTQSALQETIQPTENKQNLQVIPNNVVRIKPKGTSSLQEQNSNQLIKSSSKPKKANKLKVSEKKLQNQNSSAHFQTMKVLTNPRNLLLKPLEKNETVKCRVVNLSGFFSNELFISLKGQEKLLVSCEKQLRLIGNKILVKTADKGNLQDMQESHISQKYTQPLIGVIQSNLDGSIFNVYQNNEFNQRMELIATIQYIGNMKMSETPRKVIIYYKDRTLPTYITNMQEGQNYRDFIKRTGGNECIQILETMQPNYSNKNQLYCLCFGSKIHVQPSVHNSIFVDKDKKPVIKLFKIRENQFELICLPPLAPFVGCAYAISSFTFKLISQ